MATLLKKFTLDELKRISKNTHRSSGDPIMYTLFTKRYCALLLKFIPASITPNTITWIGLVSMLLSFTLTVKIDPLLSSAPRILYFINAVALFIYITTDSVDGMHARATNQCTVMGKILDHFIDSICVVLSMATLCSSLRTGFTVVSICVAVCSMAGFFVAEVSERFTGVLRFGSISGASEGLYVMLFIHILAFLKPGFFQKYFQSAQPLISRLCIIFTVVYLAYILLDLFRSISKNSQLASYREVFLSLLKITVLLSCTIVLLRISSNALSFLVVLNSFSTCYLEEYLASMSGFSPDHLIFVHSMGITLTYIFNALTLKFDSIGLLMSSLLFFLRSGSILRSLSRQLNIKIFNNRY